MKRLIDIALTIRESQEWKAAAANFPSDLCGMCAISTAILFRAFRRRRFTAVIHGNDRHCWLEVQHNGSWYVVDMTACQFGFRDPVLVCPSGQALNTVGRDLRRDTYAWAWELDSAFSSVKDLRKWQRARRWVPHQIV